jgi:hypothetical protein
MEEKNLPETPPVENINHRIDPRGEIFEYFWAAMMAKQNIIGHQLEESDRIFRRNLEERRRQFVESERRYQLYLDERNRQLKESDSRFYHEIEERRKKFYEERGEKYHKDDEDDDSGDDITTGKARGKKGAKKELKKAESKSGGQAEIIASSGVIQQLHEAGFKFDDICPKRKLLDEKGNIKTEIDIVMESPDCIMAVKILKKPNKKDIDNHINRMFMLKDHYAAKSNGGKYMDRRKIYGAIMADKMEDDGKQAVYDAGFFALEQSGGRLNIPKGFIPHEW